MLSLFDAVTRHQVYIERHKAHIAESFNDFLLGFDKKLKERMRDVNITAYSRNRMEALAAHVKDDMIDAYGIYYGKWREQIVDFADYEAGHQARKLNEAFGVEFAIPARAQLRKAVLSTPLSGIGGPNKADMLHAFYKTWAGSRVRTVEAIIYGGYYQGLTSQQIVNQIRGTKLNRYRDGQIAAARKDVELLTRTAVQHAATQARMEVYDANADVIGGIQIVATLDDRTTPQCRSMDGRVFRLDEEHIPLPPYHVGCRSTTVPVMRPPFDALDKGAQRIAKGPGGSELVPADMTYYEWLKTQPAQFQNDAIGPRRAELLRNGGLSAKRFSELNLGRNFQPLTLEEMKRVEPGAFEKVEKSLQKDAADSILDNTMNATGDIIKAGGISGSLSGALEPDSDEAEKHAMQYYASVRKMTTDVQNISKNTGFSFEKIERIKDHVFFKEHDLGGDKKARFEPHYGMAQSWQRLIDGNDIQPHDIILLKHETAEMYYMRKGLNQEKAHDKANIKFNYSIELKKHDLSKAKG